MRNGLGEYLKVDAFIKRWNEPVIVDANLLLKMTIAITVFSGLIASVLYYFSNVGAVYVCMVVPAVYWIAYFAYRRDLG
jgi:hypothetical protein